MFHLQHSNCLGVLISNQDNTVNRGMTIPLQGTTWKIIKRRIDTALSDTVKGIECSICEDFNKHPGNHMVSCNKCGNRFCKYCYVDIMRTNKGVIICPFCRDTFGNVCPPEIVELGIRQILSA